MLLTPCQRGRRATHESRPHIGYSLVRIIIFLSGIVCEARHEANVTIKSHIGKRAKHEATHPTSRESARRGATRQAWIGVRSLLENSREAA